MMTSIRVRLGQWKMVWVLTFLERLKCPSNSEINIFFLFIAQFSKDILTGEFMWPAGKNVKNHGGLKVKTKARFRDRQVSSKLNYKKKVETCNSSHNPH